MPMNEAVREMLPEKRRIWTLRYSRSKFSRASFSGIAVIDSELGKISVPPPEISSEAMAALQAHEWPGNVRELRNVIERVMILAPSDRLARIDADMLPAELVRGGTDILPNSESITAIPLKEARENFEREYLRIQINRFSGNISRTATFIGMERSALHRKLKLLGLTESSDGEG